ncbi:MAG: glycerol-3-phosphate acyltransferase [Dehalococcoidales bacterium]|nr:MAG: glycerol-3-phosphate acyltransferase [Dehalococcoidales bacterium]
MIVNEVITGTIAIVLAYLIGSFPSAYVVTRLMSGKDIRQLGSGNVGAHNTYREVGMAAAVLVAVLDVGKGAAAVVLAHRLVDIPLYQLNTIVLLAGVAVVAGHMWSIYIRFTGGNGLGASVGVLIMVLPWEFLIFIPVFAILVLITRNVVLSTNIGLLSVPVSAWFLEKEWLYVVFCIALIILLVLNFIPTAMNAMVKAGSRRNMADELLRRKKNQ